VAKEYSLHYHCETVHKEKFHHLEGKLMEDKFIVLKSNLQWQQNIFSIANKSSEAMVYVHFTLVTLLQDKTIHG
jgi:hypothetical protein